MKIMTLVLSLLISSNLLASSGGAQSLKELVNDLHYSLTVEWDQNDQDFLNQKSSEFQAEVSKLVRQGEISKEDLLKVYEGSIKDPKIKEVLELRIRLLDPNPSSHNLADLLNETRSSLYGKGASWNGSAIVAIGQSLLVIGTIIFAFYLITRPICEEGKTEKKESYNCGNRLVCSRHGYTDGERSYCQEYREEYKCDYRKVCI